MLTRPPGARSWHALPLPATLRAAMVAAVPAFTPAMTYISHSRSRYRRRLKVANIALILGMIAVADLALYALLYQ